MSSDYYCKDIHFCIDLNSDDHLAFIYATFGRLVIT